MMKQKFLHILILLLVTNISYGQITGSTSYSLESAIIPASNTEATITVDDDNELTFNQGTGGIIGQNGSHGAIMSNGNTITMRVASTATITFTLCKYSATGATFEFTDEGGTSIGSVIAESKTTGVDEETVDFAFSGESQVITATLNASGSVYLHAIAIDNAAASESLNGKTEVWDFGAEQLDETTYINRLDVATINAWYTYTGEQAEGDAGRNVPASFTAGSLSWTSTSSSSDRLRTTNTALTRYDSNISSDPYTGRLYINGTAQTGRYFSLLLDEDDEITLVALSQNGNGVLNFVCVADPEGQTDLAYLTGDAAEYNFVAKQSGIYKIYDTVDKPSYFRIYRKNAVYSTVSGTVDITNASGIPSEYTIVFTNEAGKTWSADPSSGSYSVDLPTDYTYEISLADANGYVLSSATSLEVTGVTSNNVVIEAVTLNTVSGTVTGLGDDLANLTLTYTPDDETKIFTPSVDLDVTTGAYSVQLEPNTAYTIVAKGVNDYSINSSSITITGDETVDVGFTAKTTYDVAIDASTLSAEQLAALSLTFTNLNEEGYSYTFTDVSTVQLRDGVYTITYDGLDAYPVELALTSNLEVNGAATSKTLTFNAVTNWSFDDKSFSSTTYKGLAFSSSVSNELAKGHIGVNDGTTISVPITTGQKVVITYYYQAGFTVNGESTIYTTVNSTGSTSKTDVVEYVYGGSESSIDITVSGTKTYFTNIEVLDVVTYAAQITVGTDKDYQTINEALAAIALMDRSSDERVSIIIDPGNYEEMVVINQDNISFVNASSAPSIALKDGGVNIDDDAVRVTSYYGHGYSYYSMGNDQKWNSDVLQVNKDNGYLSYENAGSGTTNGSYWNATVVVYADGFEAENIIFENSFNQYISQKESEDIVVEWTNGSKGTRPTDVGNTDVQNKSFVERAAALAITGGDKMILNNCRLVGRQDVFFGGTGSRVAVYKGNIMGGTDYIFGGMTAVFYKSALAMNTSEDSNDVAYITAGQQGEDDRGYLMYECTITSATPGVDNTSSYRSKPGSFGRCWSGPTCEVIFYNTTIETSNNPSYAGESLIIAEGWSNGLGGPSLRVGEYGTTEESGVDNSASRVSGAEVSGDWGTTVLSSPLLRDGSTAITTLNFTQGDDGWDPIPTLVSDDPTTDVKLPSSDSEVLVLGVNNEIVVKGIYQNSIIKVFNLQGKLVKSIQVSQEARMTMPAGCWIVNVTDNSSSVSSKILTQ